MFVKVVPYYNQLCANWCHCCAVIDSGDGGVVQNGTSNDNNNHSAVENGNLKRQPAPTTSRNSNRTHVFENVFRNPPNFVRFCCCWSHNRNNSPSSLSSNQNKGTAKEGENDDDDGVDGVTNVVPLDGGTIYTPLKNFIGRDEQQLILEDDGVGGQRVENGHPQGQGQNVDVNRSRASSAADTLSSGSGPTTEELDKSEDEK